MTLSTPFKPLLAGMQMRTDFTCIRMPKPIWAPAPYVDRESSGGMTGVWLSENEEVEWHKQYNPDGTVSITGYTITTKPIVVSNAVDI